MIYKLSLFNNLFPTCPKCHSPWDDTGQRLFCPTCPQYAAPNFGAGVSLVRNVTPNLHFIWLFKLKLNNDSLYLYRCMFRYWDDDGLNHTLTPLVPVDVSDEKLKNIFNKLLVLQ